MCARDSLRSPGPEHSNSNSFLEHPHEANGLNKEELRKGCVPRQFVSGKLVNQ